MARRQILSLSERESLLALPDDELTLTRMAYFSEHDLALISAHRKPNLQVMITFRLLVQRIPIWPLNFIVMALALVAVKGRKYGIHVMRAC